ncbi:hypothetical protein [Aurantiacibacter aquimixticola]|uniref:Acid phosphatase n=1 Tax=Aurantiacibacter aquimixticola TaxID=1958945 RepID=A0A419RVD7_9SPHN|nr:hypothetical protein [Aurantiacibacter aquimixticola]RJY09740.1 hypothetical protein D6201_10605 [Aurantiacibacter aquimixticola]
MTIARALPLILATLLLQGCIALAAVPIVASTGAMAYSGLSGERTREAIAEGNPFEAEDVDLEALGDFVVLDMSELPAPATPLLAGSAYAALRDHTLAAVSDRGVETPILPASAMLAKPTDLQPDRAQCEAPTPVVLVDLDPEGRLMPLEPGTQVDGQLVTALGALRQSEIAVAWMTDREPGDAGRIRTILRESGLDPTGRDPLFVQRFPGEEKQVRRRALLETHCPIAIAGDTRADFDDVYLHLRYPDAAAALEAMIGEGWFLIPNPID